MYEKWYFPYIAAILFIAFCVGLSILIVDVLAPDIERELTEIYNALVRDFGNPK